MNSHSQPQSNPNKKPHEAKIELSRLRFIARLCVAVACFIQFLGRIVLIHLIINDHSPNVALRLLSLPGAPVVTLIVLFEYLLFRKIGEKILKYSQVFDIIILFVFTTDWIIGLTSSFQKTSQKDPALFGFSTAYAVTGMAWKTLLVTLMVQKWQLKIIAPTAVIILSTVFAIHYDPHAAYVYVIRCATQVFNVIFIIICEDKIKWKMIWANLQQEKWVQVNNFILNNIPENIMILDIKGEAKFISDYCKNFMAKCFHQDQDPKKFFNKIKDLQQQHQYDCESPTNHPNSFALKVERLTTGNELLMTESNSNYKVEILTDLISNFQEIIKEKNLEEKQFLIYNGKLKTETQEKSIEVKISFIQHFECEYIILILRDTTKRDLLLTLEETNKYKDQLLASVSHELRAPLNGNINLVESAVNSPKLPQGLKENLLVPALRSSKFLLHIINDIIDMSQIKQKKLRLAFQTGDLTETLKSTAQLIELQAKKKGINLALEFDPKLPKNFFTDHMRLSQIVLNLLSNAMKFTSKGVIKLIAAPINNSTWVKVTVEDSGIGMSQEDMNKLFSSYTHIEFEGRQAMNPSGVGLGLNISSNLVELLAPKGHPNLSVWSTPNKGSRFSFIIENKEDCLIINHSEPEDSNDSNLSVHIAEELPETIQPVLYSKLQTLESSNSDAELSETSCGCPRILIVDDNPFNVMAFETILNSFNIKCDSVYCGSSAIEKLQNRGTLRCGKDCKAYSVIFMDQEMPGMNGSETVREIRRLEKEGVVPEMRIIGCTAHQAKEEVDMFLESGLDKCISKPISAHLIKSLL